MILVVLTVDVTHISLPNSAIGAIIIGQLLFNLLFLVDPLKALLRRVFLGFFLSCV